MSDDPTPDAITDSSTRAALRQTDEYVVNAYLPSGQARVEVHVRLGESRVVLPEGTVDVDVAPDFALRMEELLDAELISTQFAFELLFQVSVSRQYA